VETVELFENGDDQPDVVILDVLMPNLDGFSTCRAIREHSNVPVLMLTARRSVADRVEGFAAGADDYLGKPFALAELLARIRSLVRRASPVKHMLRYADLELEPSERRVSRGGRPIELTRIEFSLLELFMSHPHTVHSRSSIFRAVWGYDIEYASNSLDVYVGFLRRKTEAAGEPRLIHTVRGVGFVLREAR
jgi:two-component system response regulator MprA